jgi:hypothetical protein
VLISESFAKSTPAITRAIVDERRAQSRDSHRANEARRPRPQAVPVDDRGDHDQPIAANVLNREFEAEGRTSAG